MDHEQFGNGCRGLINPAGSNAVKPKQCSREPRGIRRRRCRRCDTPGAVARGLTFDAATGTPLLTTRRNGRNTAPVLPKAGRLANRPNIAGLP